MVRTARGLLFFLLPSGSGTGFAFEHLQHAIRDNEAANNVSRRTGYRDKSKNGAHGALMRARGDQRTDKRNAGYGVRRRHQRRMQEGGNGGKNLEAKKGAQ